MEHTNEYITNRFYEALDMLVADGIYNSYYHFAEENDLDRSSLNRTKKEPGRRKLHLFWISPLILHHGLDAKWLFGGEGYAYPKGIKKAKRVLQY